MQGLNCPGECVMCCCDLTQSSWHFSAALSLSCCFPLCISAALCASFLSTLQLSSGCLLLFALHLTFICTSCLYKKCLSTRNSVKMTQCECVHRIWNYLSDFFLCGTTWIVFWVLCNSVELFSVLCARGCCFFPAITTTLPWANLCKGGLWKRLCRSGTFVGFPQG